MNMDEYTNQYQYNRNYGCRIHEFIYKGFKSLMIENEKIRCLILVEKGTDIIEFLYKPKDIDFMWKSPVDLDQPQKAPVTKEDNSGGFYDTYFGGWHEMLPNIYLPSKYKGANFGLHGEVTNLPWKYELIKDSPEEMAIKFFVRMMRTPFYVEKIFKIKSGSSYIEFEESITNEANEDFEFMWGHHPAFGKPFLSQYCVISLPKDVIGKTLETDYSGNSPFPVNKEFKWPVIMDKKGREIDVSRVMGPDAKKSFNIYIKELNEGWYGITNTKLGVGFGLKWDIKIYKYIMLWLSYMGFYNFPFYGRAYTIGVEPWSAIPGDFNEILSKKQGIVIKPHETITTKYHAITYESKRKISGFNDDNSVKK